MTHDELLAYINKEIDQAAWSTEYFPFKPLQALRAVVELHKPEIASFDLGPEYLACGHCIESTNDRDYQVDYPCPTIQAIEGQLG